MNGSAPRCRGRCRAGLPLALTPGSCASTAPAGPRGHALCVLRKAQAEAEVETPRRKPWTRRRRIGCFGAPAAGTRSSSPDRIDALPAVRAGDSSTGTRALPPGARSSIDAPADVAISAPVRAFVYCAAIFRTGGASATRSRRRRTVRGVAPALSRPRRTRPRPLAVRRSHELDGSLGRPLSVVRSGRFWAHFRDVDGRDYLDLCLAIPAPWRGTHPPPPWTPSPRRRAAE